MDNQKEFEEGLRTFEEARKIGPFNVNAYYLPGTYLARAGRNDESYSLLKKALSLAPNSTSIHERFWQTILALKEMSSESKREEIETDIASFLQNCGKNPGALHAVVNIYRQLKLPDKRKAIEEKILTRFRESGQAEWVLINRYRDFEAEFGEDGFKEPEKEKQYRKMLRDFIERPQSRDVPPWMQKNGYDFTVLFDDGYVTNQARIHTFPTTWILDKQGRKAFIKKGWTEKLLEEFSWRIEALRATEVQVKKK